MKHNDFILKVLTLGVGMAISFVLIAKVTFEISYDKCYTDSERIYQIRTFFSYGDDDPGNDAWNISGAIAPGVMEYCPGVEAATRITPLFQSDKYLTDDENVVSGKLLVADSMFFEIFDRPILSGDPRKVLATPCQVMVSRSFAEKLGGVEKAVGKTFCNETMTNIPLTIGGVYEDFPKNSSIGVDMLLSMKSLGAGTTQNWVGNDRYYGWVKLAKGVSPDDLKKGVRFMQEKHQDIVEQEKKGARMEYSFVPIEKSHFVDTSARPTVIILSFITFLLLAISILNYVLIAVSDIVRRSKEVAMRKCYGAIPRNIYAMLLRETSVVLLVALGVAVLMVWGAQSIIYQLVGVQLKEMLIPQLFEALAVVVVIVLLVSTVLPGMLYTKIPVNLIFTRLIGSKRRWKLTLLCVQFVISIVLVVFMIIIWAQYRYAMTNDMGYNYENVLVIRRGGLSYEELQRAVEPLRGMAEVEEVCLASTVPIEGFSGNIICTKESELFNIADQYFMQPEFFKIFGIEILEGRVPETVAECVISESCARKIREYDPWKNGVVGQGILLTEHGNITVTGIYREYFLGSISSPDDSPSIISGFSSGIPVLGTFMRYLLVKLKDMTPESLAAVEKTIGELYPKKQLEVKPYTDLMVEAYRAQEQMRNTISIGSFFAILVALLGLIGYLRDETRRRTKEMAIRKINGATTRELLGLFVKDILKIFLVALVISNIVAWVVADYWLDMFAWKISLSVGLFLLSDLIVMAIVVAVVVLNTLKIVRANPVDSLTDE